MLEWFEEIRRFCPVNGFAPQVIVWSELRAWRKENKIKLSPWVVKLLMMIQDIYIEQWVTENQNKN